MVGVHEPPLRGDLVRGDIENDVAPLGHFGPADVVHALGGSIEHSPGAGVVRSAHGRRRHGGHGELDRHRPVVPARPLEGP